MRKADLKVRPYPHAPSSPWVIDTRQEVDGKLKRKRLFFATKTAADQELTRIKIKLNKEGSAALSLSDATRFAAMHGEKALAGYGKSIGDAIEFYLKYLADSLRSIPIRQLVTEYLAHKAQLGLSDVHQTDLRNRFNQFCADYGDTGTRTLTTKQVQEWLYGLKLSHQSVNNYRSRLGALFGFGVKKGYLDRNPIDDIEKKKVVDHPPEIYSVDDLARLLQSASPELVPLVALGAFAGIRTAELLKLGWEDIDLARGKVNISTAKSKTAARRNIAMEPCLRSWLAPYAGRTGQIFDGNIYSFLHLLRIACKAAGIKSAKNGLRHSFCSYHIAKYQDAAKLALDMGHTTTKLIFSNYRELVTREEAERYFNIFPPAQAENVVPMARDAPNSAQGNP
jgi:integrase